MSYVFFYRHQALKSLEMYIFVPFSYQLIVQRNDLMLRHGCCEKEVNFTCEK